MKSRARRLLGWFDERLGLSESRQRLAAATVAGDQLERMLLACAAFLLVVLTASGVLLSMHYRPSVAEAHHSVMVIASVVPFGALVRGIHQYACDMLLLVAVAYLFWLAVRRAYVAGGELMWMAGCLSLLALGAMAITGSILTWSGDAVAHARVAGGLSGRMPLLGDWLRRMLLGADVVGPQTLSRAFSFHVAVLPASMTLLCSLQLRLWRQWRQLRDRRAVAGIALYPAFVAKVAAVLAGVLLLLVALATLWPRALAGPADLSTATTLATPPWYLAGFHQLLRSTPSSPMGLDGSRAILALSMTFTVAAFMLPLLDRRGSRVAAVVAVLTLMAFVGLTFYGLA